MANDNFLTDRRTDRVITIGHPPSGGATLMLETWIKLEL